MLIASSLGLCLWTELMWWNCSAREGIFRLNRWQCNVGSPFYPPQSLLVPAVCTFMLWRVVRLCLLSLTPRDSIFVKEIESIAVSFKRLFLCVRAYAHILSIHTWLFCSIVLYYSVSRKYVRSRATWKLSFLLLRCGFLCYWKGLSWCT